MKIAVNVCCTTLTPCDLSVYAHGRLEKVATVSEMALTVTRQYFLELERNRTCNLVRRNILGFTLVYKALVPTDNLLTTVPPPQSQIRTFSPAYMQCVSEPHLSGTHDQHTDIGLL